MYNHPLFFIQFKQDLGTIFATKPAHHRSRVLRRKIRTPSKKNLCFGVSDKEHNYVGWVSTSILNLLLTNLRDVRVDIVRVHQVATSSRTSSRIHGEDSTTAMAWCCPGPHQQNEQSTRSTGFFRRKLHPATHRDIGMSVPLHATYPLKCAQKKSCDYDFRRRTTSRQLFAMPAIFDRGCMLPQKINGPHHIKIKPESRLGQTIVSAPALRWTKDISKRCVHRCIEIGASCPYFRVSHNEGVHSNPTLLSWIMTTRPCMCPA